MGVVHKLRPEVLSFIIDNKQKNSALSCRQLATLIVEQFHIEISKSSINSIFKENNLSLPIGRRPKQKRSKFRMPDLPVMEGIKAIALVEEQVINSSLRGAEGDEANTENEIASSTSCSRNDENEIVKEEPNLEEKRIKEAEELALKLQKEERVKEEERIKLEAEAVAKKAEQERLENEQQAVRQAQEEIKRLKEAAELEAEKAKLVKEAEEKIRQELEDANRLAEVAAKKVEQERLAEAAVKKAEQERLENEQQAVRQAQEEIKRLKEAAELKAEKAKLVKEAEEKIRQELDESNRLAEVAAKKAEQERLAEAVAKKAEQERLENEQQAVRQAQEEIKRLKEEAELKSQPPDVKEEVAMQEVEASSLGPLLQDRVCPGAIFLKAIDCLAGGSKQINEVICKALGNNPEDFTALTQAVIFRTLFDQGGTEALSSLVGQQIFTDQLNRYYAEINQNEIIKLEVARIISGAFIQVRSVKVHSIDGSVVYLDGQLHTIWPTPNLPFDFCNVVYDLKNNLDKYFFQNQPLVLLSVPGYASPTKEFFDLLLNISSPDKRPDTLILYGNKLEELERIILNPKNNNSFIFGLWPWQFASCRKVKRIGDFNRQYVESLGKDFYLAQIELDLSLPSTNQSISLQGCAVKTDPNQKICVVILSSDQKAVDLNKLADTYLSRWPNLDEGFKDFSRKVEVFSYTSSTQTSSPTENPDLSKIETDVDLERTFASYVKILDAYLRCHFLPTEYLEKDVFFTVGGLYNAQMLLATHPRRVTIRMQDNPEKFPAKDLGYLMRRLNEIQIRLSGGQILCFENVFK